MLDVSIIADDDITLDLPVKESDMHKYAVHVLQSSGIKSSEVNIVFIGDDAMTVLNETYKKREGTTDVLSFTLSEENAEILVGEIYISLERAKAQATEFFVPFPEEIVRLVTHGLLHLTGKVHDTDESHGEMNELTERFLDDYFGGENQR